VFLLILVLLISLLIISTPVLGQTAADSLDTIKESYEDEQFAGTLKMEGPFPTEVDEIKIIFFKGTEKKEESSDKVSSGTWSFETDVNTWVEGEYNVKLLAHDTNGSVIGETNFKIKIESEVTEGPQQGEIFDSKFINKYDDKKIEDKLKMSTTLPDNVISVRIEISKKGKEIVDETKSDLDNSWSYETSVSDWDAGEYDVILTAKNITGDALDTAVFQFKVTEEEPFYMPLFCAILLIVFIVLLVVFFILSLMKHKKIMQQIRFKPKDVKKKLPLMSFASMLISMLFVLGGLSVSITAGLDLISFILFLIVLGFLMLVTYWAFSNRNSPPFLVYLIFMILSLIVLSLASVWSESDAFGLVVGTWIIIAAMIIYFISILIYWLSSRRGYFIALVTMILSLVFFIIALVFAILATLDFFINWSIAFIIGMILAAVLLLLSWVILRDDLFYFEFREESKTHRGSRNSLNMFDVLSIPRGLMKREYDRKVMAKVSYEKTQDKKVRMEVISLRSWDNIAGRNQGRRLMGVFTNHMRGKEGPPFKKEPVASSVKYTIYSSDTNLDDKLKLTKSFGFDVTDSGRERGLDYFDLELVHKPFLGLGSPMGSQKPKKDYDKDSGYARDKDKEKEKDREHRYDYEHEEEQRREERRRDEQAAYQHEQERRSSSRSRHDEEPEEDLEDWGAVDSPKKRDRDRDRDRDYDRDRDRARERDRDRQYERDREHRREPEPESEPEPEKPKKRPPPPKIIPK
jgi:hypothetical protein